MTPQLLGNGPRKAFGLGSQNKDGCGNTYVTIPGFLNSPSEQGWNHLCFFSVFPNKQKFTKKKNVEFHCSFWSNFWKIEGFNNIEKSILPIVASHPVFPFHIPVFNTKTKAWTRSLQIWFIQNHIWDGSWSHWPSNREISGLCVPGHKVYNVIYTSIAPPETSLQQIHSSKTTFALETFYSIVFCTKTSFTIATFYNLQVWYQVLCATQNINNFSSVNYLQQKHFYHELILLTVSLSVFCSMKSVPRSRVEETNTNPGTDNHGGNKKNQCSRTYDVFFALSAQIETIWKKGPITD